jgi:diacylglycerol kinase family enzyme
MKRAILIYNPEATTVTPGVRDVITRALASDVVVDVAPTKRRGHAMHLSAGAVHDGYDLVACLGGDGTLNEVVNGLAGTGVPLATIPGGGTNVFARTLGYPEDPVEATALLLSRLREGAPPRVISLGRVNGRAFAFCAGVGLDASVVKAVERRFRMKKRIGEWFFVTTALRVFFFAYDRSSPPLTLRLPDGSEEAGIHFAVCGNSDPYTFLGSRPFRVTPSADLDRGLDLTAFRSARVGAILRTVWRAFGSGGHVKLSFVRALHDVPAFELSSERPLGWQVDGDYLGEETLFRFSSEPGALSVIA